MSEILFGRLLESNNNNEDGDLHELERDLKNKIEKAKLLASSLKSTHESEDIFATTSTGQLVFPEFHNDVNYNEEFWKTYLKNELNFALIKELSERSAELQELVKDIEGAQEEYFRLYKLKNRKKNRRLDVEIEKKFECPYEKCYKIYGSDVSLNLHIKLKHNGAEEICLAELNKEDVPVMRFNLPPGYLEDYRRNHFMQKPTADKIEENEEK